MALTSHVVIVLERSCYGWGHIMRISDSIFVNKIENNFKINLDVDKNFSMLQTKKNILLEKITTS